ncbi:MAG: hypothetical protein AAAB35_01435 [Phyllobacterium sp.]|uniref:hypothetical protein n=1 Tax=Phyllobacterium sp. TaxID=1871046 RepID=UPI0030F30118
MTTASERAMAYVHELIHVPDENSGWTLTDVVITMLRDAKCEDDLTHIVWFLAGYNAAIIPDCLDDDEKQQVIALVINYVRGVCADNFRLLH